MTTVKKIARHKIRNIEPALQESLISVAHGMSVADLLPLSAYLCMTGQSLGVSGLSGRKGAAFALGYLGALHSPMFLGPQSVASIYQRCSRFKVSAEALGCQIKVRFSTKEMTPELAAAAKRFDASELIEEEIWRWSGWPIESQNGTVQYAHLDAVYEVMGRPFTEHLHQVFRAYKKARRGATLGSITSFAAFIEALGGTTSHEMWLREGADVPPPSVARRFRVRDQS